MEKRVPSAHCQATMTSSCEWRNELGVIGVDSQPFWAFEIWSLNCMGQFCNPAWSSYVVNWRSDSSWAERRECASRKRTQKILTSVTVIKKIWKKTLTNLSASIFKQCVPVDLCMKFGGSMVDAAFLLLISLRSRTVRKDNWRAEQRCALVRMQFQNSTSWTIQGNPWVIRSGWNFVKSNIIIWSARRKIVFKRVELLYGLIGVLSLVYIYILS